MSKVQDKKTKSGLLPRLRFQEFLDAGEWEVHAIGSFIEEYREKTTEQDEFEVLTSAKAGLVRQREYYDNDRITERINIGFNIIPPYYLTYRSRSDNRSFFFNENKLGITGIVSTYYPVFRILNGSNQFFIELLSHYSTLVGKHSVGTSQTVLSLNELKRIILSIPAQREQQKIADCLTSIDELIALHRKKLETLKTYKKGLMQQLFPSEGETVPRLRFPEFRDAPEWIQMNGDTVFDQIINKNHNSDLPVLAITQDYGAIPRNMIDYQVSVTDKSIESYKIVEVGDFIISLRSFQGGIEFSDYKGICSPAYIILRKKTNLHDIFYKHYFKTDAFITLLNKNIEGIRDGKMVSYKQFSDLLLPFPSVKEQQKIADCLTSLDELIASHTKKLENLKVYKKGLMQQLFPASEGDS